MQRIIPYYNIAWSGRDPKLRNVGRVKRSSGWPGFVSRISPVAEEYRRVWFHNPFGALKGESMQFAQRSQASKQGLRWLVEKFGPSVRRLTDRDIEVVAYLGSPRQLRIEKRENWESWLKRAMRELQPLVDAGCSLGFDATYGGAEMGPDSYPYRLLQILTMYRVKIYCEPWARADSTHMFKLGFITRESFYRKNRKHRKWAPKEKITGEVVRLLLPQPKDIRQAVAQVHADRHTALVSEHRLAEL